LDLGRVGYVAAGADGRAGPVGVDTFRHCPGGVRIQVGDDYPGTLLSQFRGQRAADAAPAAGHDSDFFGNLHNSVLIVGGKEYGRSELPSDRSDCS
jgi:hypothetical protein